MSQQVLQKANESFDKSLSHLQEEYSKLQVGRASSGMVEGLNVDSYGSVQPLKNIASISVPDARSVQIQPWDKSMLAAIEKAINDSDLNLNPTNNGASIILNIPSLTEERRKDLVKIVGRYSEEAKISVRNARHDAMAIMKRMESAGDMSEDDRKRGEKKLQEKVDSVNSEIVDLAKQKEEAIMTV